MTMGFWKSTSPLKNAGKPGRRKTGEDARTEIEEAIKGHRMKVEDGLQYVKFPGEGWVSLDDTEKIQRIIAESQEQG